MVMEMDNGGNRKNSREYVFCLAKANITGSLQWSTEAFSLLWPMALRADYRWPQATGGFDGR
jgi:hypothetical protein